MENENKSETVDQNHSVVVPLKTGYTESEKMEMCNFCYVDSFDDHTEFINIKYDNGDVGQSCIILGALGFHARLTGNQSYVGHNEKLGIDMPIENNFDVATSIRRVDCNSVAVVRRKIDWSKNKSLTFEEMAKKPEHLYDVVISYVGGSLALHGLPLDTAIIFKKIIYNWMIFNHPVMLR